AALIMSAVSSIVSGRPYGERLPRTLRPVQYTVAPDSASARAMPRPAPRVAPATTATCPARPRCDVRDADTRLLGSRNWERFFNGDIRQPPYVSSVSTTLGPDSWKGSQTLFQCAPPDRWGGDAWWAATLACHLPIGYQ